MKRKITRPACLLLLVLGIGFSLRADREAGSRREMDEAIVRLQKAIHKEGLSWQAGETSMSRLSPEERRRRLGALPETFGVEAEASEPAVAAGRPAALPAMLDWRDRNGNWVTGVRDQGSCGSCWAFAVAGVLESLVKRGLGIAGDFDLAEQMLLSCSGAGNCGGGYISLAAEFLVSTGVPREACFPYSAKDESCSPCAGWMAHAVRAGSWQWLYNAAPVQLQEALLEAPFAASMEVYSDFFHYRSGIYERAAAATLEGGHGVLVVGYNDAEGYWICKNSWGDDWGENGFFRIRWGQVSICRWSYFLREFFITNQPPVLPEVSALRLEEGREFSYTLGAVDEDLDVLTYSVDSLPPGAAIDAASGVFTWKPGYTQAGAYPVRFRVSDGMGTAVRDVVLTVADVKYKKW